MFLSSLQYNMKWNITAVPNLFASKSSLCCHRLHAGLMSGAVLEATSA